MKNRQEFIDRDKGKLDSFRVNYKNFTVNYIYIFKYKFVYGKYNFYDINEICIKLCHILQMLWYDLCLVHSIDFYRFKIYSGNNYSNTILFIKYVLIVFTFNFFEQLKVEKLVALKNDFQNCNIYAYPFGHGTPVPLAFFPVEYQWPSIRVIFFLFRVTTHLPHPGAQVKHTSDV